MNKEVAIAIKSLKKDLEDKKFDNGRAINYINYAELVKRHSVDEIDSIKHDFLKEARGYLANYFPNKFCIWGEDNSIYVGTYNYLNTFIDRAERFLVKGYLRKE